MAGRIADRSQYQFTPAISRSVDRATQAEVDHDWNGLLEGGGTPVPCGWLTDRFGISWQIVPSVLVTSLRDKDAARANRVMLAMMKTVKLDVAGLQAAYDGA